MGILRNIKEIDELITSALAQGLFPGLGLAVAMGGKGERQREFFARGTTRSEGGSAITSETFFDLASLTKPLATTLLLMTLAREGALRLDEPIARFFSQVPPDKEGITLADLLRHSSGLAAHQPYFERLADVPLVGRKERLLRMILDEPLAYPRGSKALYSDLGFLLLGMMVEEAGGQELDTLFKDRIARPLGIEKNLFFNRLGAIRPGSYAATEFCPWRGRVLAGEVSDENCFALGGVAGHAGLFGTMGALLALVEEILDLWQGEAGRLAIAPQALGHLLTRQPIPGSTWALGFDTPSAGASSAGRFFSPDSVGHLGFTGTSFWIDPIRRVVVVLLTNRVHPSRENNGIRGFRPALHDAVMAGLGFAP